MHRGRKRQPALPGEGRWRVAKHDPVGAKEGTPRRVYKSPSKDAAETVKKGSVEAMAFPDFFPNQGGLPILVDGQILGGVAASGAKSEIDEAIAQAGIDALLKK